MGFHLLSMPMPAALLLAFIFAPGSVDASLEEIVVTARTPLVDANLLEYGPVKVEYRSSLSRGIHFDSVSMQEKSRDILAVKGNGFGVKVFIKSSPRQVINVAEVWSHAPVVNLETNKTQEFKVWIHTLDLPDTYVFYFPIEESWEAVPGEWTLMLYMIDDVGPIASNALVTGSGDKYEKLPFDPFFQYTFHLYKPRRQVLAEGEE